MKPPGGPGPPSTFADRTDAGRRLAALVAGHLGPGPTGVGVGGGVVLGLPRGGVPVAFEVAAALAWPLDVVLVRKLGLPSQPELALGAIGEGGAQVLNDQVLAAAGLGPADLSRLAAEQQAELARQAGVYRHDRGPAPLAGRTAVVVDDGMATGATARAACGVLRARGAARLIVAVPVATRSVVEELAQEVEVLCVAAPENLVAVGQWYADFSQVSEDEVVRLLAAA